MLFKNLVTSPSRVGIYLPFPRNWVGLSGCLNEQNVAEAMLCDF